MPNESTTTCAIGKGKDAMNINTSPNKKLLTVGDLVVAVTDVAYQVSHDEKKSYQIASIVVDKLLRCPPAKKYSGLVH